MTSAGRAASTLTRGAQPAAVLTHEYRLWPGPNSNTFTAYIVRRVPELGVGLPAIAIGKDYLEDGRFFASAPGGRGAQISLFGLAGVIVGIEEGIEVNLLGLVFGAGPSGPAIKLPGIGGIGLCGPKVRTRSAYGPGWSYSVAWPG